MNHGQGGLKTFVFKKIYFLSEVDSYVSFLKLYPGIQFKKQLGNSCLLYKLQETAEQEEANGLMHGMKFQ